MFDKYEVIEKRRIEDLNSEGIILRHKKTGANVALLLNDDENKVFYIGFRTPPTDSTGVAHILEHSVLCGSKDFPVKDPFIELAKGSLNTFLNAMTYPDKTVYPVASCNDADFKNLVHVYLDAVFHPNIYKEEKIFRQEGWHYEMADADDELTINGVVYNEMKGVYSSPDDVVEHEIMASLYPDTTYGKESGGAPEDIPSLSYEDFLNFHSKYYHPSNSFIYLYGNLDAEEYLKYIDEEYLSFYEFLEVDSKIQKQPAFDAPKHIEKEYSVLEEDEGTYLTYNVSVGTSLDKNLYVAMDVLDYVLCSAPGAILKKALIDAGVGDDVYSSVEGGIYQPYFAVTAKNAKPEDKDKFINIIESELKRAVKEGLPAKAIKAALNHFEFKYREADFGSYPRGLMLGLQALDSWLYDPTLPFLHIEANNTYAFLKDSIDKGYFEDLVSEYILNNTHKSILTVSPHAGLTSEKDNALKEKLSSYKASLTKEQIDQIVENTAALKAYQSEPSPKEDLEKIPMLKRSDLKKEAMQIVNEEYDSDGTKVLFHDIFTNGIGYLRLMFKMNDVPGDLFPYISVLKGVLGMMGTENYTYDDLFNELNIHTGGFTVDSKLYTDYSKFPDYNSFFYVSSKMLYPKLDRAFELIEEIIFKTDFSDYKRLYEILTEIKVRMQSSMISAGHTVALGRCASYIFETSAIEEELNGLPFYKRLVFLTDNFEEQKKDLVEKLSALCKCIFRKENLFVDFTSTKDEVTKLMDILPAFKDKLYTTPYEKAPFAIEVKKKNEGLFCAGLVQYVCRAGNYLNKGLPYTGALKVLRVIMGYDYLWNNVRVLGGAYGCMSGFARNGLGFFVSYRDPNLDNTISVYEKAAEYVKSMDLDERTVTQFIIGTLSDVDVPMTPATKGAFSMVCYLNNITDEDNQKERDEILSVNEDVIHGLSEYIQAFISDECLCVVGNVDTVRASENIFMSVEALN